MYITVSTIEYYTKKWPEKEKARGKNFVRMADALLKNAEFEFALPLIRTFFNFTIQENSLEMKMACTAPTSTTFFRFDRSIGMKNL